MILRVAPVSYLPMLGILGFPVAFICYQRARRIHLGEHEFLLFKSNMVVVWVTIGVLAFCVACECLWSVL